MPSSPSGAEGRPDTSREARAYNHSIYLMVGMPYLLLGVVGFLIYRGVKKNQAARLASAAAGPEGHSCAPPSTAVNSSPEA